MYQACTSERIFLALDIRPAGAAFLENAGWNYFVYLLVMFVSGLYWDNLESDAMIASLSLLLMFLLGLYWDNLESDAGQLYKLSQCDDHVTKWLSRSTYSPLTEWDQNDNPVLEQVSFDTILGLF